jgi:hypothetical protein
MKPTSQPIPRILIADDQADVLESLRLLWSAIQVQQ